MLMYPSTTRTSRTTFSLAAEIPLVHLLCTPLLLLILLGGCNNEPDAQNSSSAAHPSSCVHCHDLTLDAQHAFSCTTCHEGDEQEADRELAHQNLIARPAHPEHAPTYCGGCHQDEIHMVSANNHYTLANHIDLVREAFGAKPEHNTLANLRPVTVPGDGLELVDDLLRRRCLRCHVYTSGDDYPAVFRGTGCAACHLNYQEGTLNSHLFKKEVADSNCLSCHYSNHVGFDYYGRYEHDFNNEYRTPYVTFEDHFRPYGIEYHQLSPDVHQQGGMRCTACHTKTDVMGGSSVYPSCTGCHAQTSLENTLPPGVSKTADGYILTDSSPGQTKRLIPLMDHPAHKQYGESVSCHACHAQWSFNDKQTHLLRIDHDDLEPFLNLSVDGSREVETILRSHIDFDGEWLSPTMTDKLSGERQPGIWLKGYSERRWEQIPLGYDDNNMITTVRPILDLSLSWIDEQEEVRFDNLKAVDPSLGSIPYAPHTIGKAGIFYETRLRDFHRVNQTSISPQSRVGDDQSP